MHGKTVINHFKVVSGSEKNSRNYVHYTSTFTFVTYILFDLMLCKYHDCCDTSYNAVLVFISACIKPENDLKKQKIILYVTFSLPPVL